MRRALIAAGILFLAAFCITLIALRPRPAKVEVKKLPSGYQMLVNGRPFYIKGAGLGRAFGKKGENYMRMAREMGANTVRTWGPGKTEEMQAYLDEAHRQGLMVNLGICWVSYPDRKKVPAHITDEEFLRKKAEETLGYVRRFKDHPAILMWNFGNEPIRFHAKTEKGHIRLYQMMEDMTKEIHKIDPNHPVSDSCGSYRDLGYFKKYVPSLDIISIKDWGDAIVSEARWRDLQFDKPYLFSEFGPLGYRNRNSPSEKKDPNGRFIEWGDRAKAANYRNEWNLIWERRQNNFGGFAFHIGEMNSETLTAWNMNFHEYKRESFLIMQELYTGKKVKDRAPWITWSSLTPHKVRPNQRFMMILQAKDDTAAPLTYEYRVSTSIEEVVDYYVNEEVPVHVQSSGRWAVLTAPAKQGIYRVYGIVKDAAGNVATVNSTLKVE